MCLAGEAFSPPGRWDFEIAWDPSLKRVLRFKQTRSLIDVALCRMICSSGASCGLLVVADIDVASIRYAAFETCSVCMTS
uniref:Uncharacterized protein n=1 Tax=Physcomitrium patens TaxID=3218 RepID=A0A7I4ACW0_PHYPA